MYIKEIILDGFKSYARRTVVSGFDQSFNAITGMNGTGKSNILDAICFVLGISNLSQVRVGSLQELVYKQGQAGITKATVSIVFDNRDKTQSPMGYEHNEEITVTRQVVIGGRNKYLINGHTAQLNRVQNLFHSVQLNVNNPHFLIMQGRITKVLNMKPPEILSMIEEAAGTRMFEMKKATALKTITKKDKKLSEIDTVLCEDITPTLEKLRKERSQYIKWTQNNQECERLNNFCMAYQYYNATHRISNSDTQIEELNSQVTKYQQHSEQLGEQINNIDQQIQQLKKEKSSVAQKELKKFEAEVRELSKSLVKIRTTYNHKVENFESESQRLKQLESEINDTENNLNSLKERHKIAQQASTELETESRNLDERLDNLHNQMQSVSAGVAAGGDSGKSLTEQLMDVKESSSQLSTEKKQAKMKLSHLEKDLNSKKQHLNDVDDEFESSRNQYEKYNQQLQAIEEQMQQLNYDPSELKQYQNEKLEQEHIITEFKEKISQLKAMLSVLSFKYDNPEPNFDRSKVKGFVAQLVQVQDMSCATALEMAAGQRLYQIVVDSNDTSTKLLEHGNLKKRVTIIPLDKIDARGLKPGVAKKAEHIGNGKAKLALELIGYEKEVEEAMKYVFGKTIVCKDLETARKVTYNKEVMARSVTLEGDVCEPSGTLTGGQAPPSQSVLRLLDQLNTAHIQLQEAKKKWQDINSKLKSLMNIEPNYKELKQQAELANHQIQLLKGTAEQSKHHQLLVEIEKLEKTFASEQSRVQTCDQKLRELEQEKQQLESDIENFDSYKERKAQEIKDNIKSTKERRKQCRNNAKTKQAEQEQLAMEIEETQSELEQIHSQKRQLKEELYSLESSVNDTKQEMEQISEQYEQKKSQLDEYSERMSHNDEKISELANSKNQITETMNENSLNIKDFKHKISQIRTETQEANKLIKSLEKKHKWILKERHNFGQPDTQFDFAKNDPQEAQKILNQLQKEQKQISKSINKKVMSMFEQAEQEYQELMQKKHIVEKDKHKINQVIQELDQKKKQALEETWQKVNKDFGNIYSTLLPGASAKLEPVEGGSVLDGLEVKVAFGEVWKESLTELSGGQRSLLALSLILALLLFKPAPMYILDEVDAALDLSHTQNIGRMLRTHFSNSQFIIVSLKEGMFNNANVIFRTKFVNGCSSVMRTSNQKQNKSSSLGKKSVLYNKEKENAHPNY